MLGAVGVGIYKDIHEATANMVHVDKRWEPIPANVKTYEELFGIFEDGFHALRPKFFPGLVEFQSRY
jgi:xylulokinase